MSERTSWKNEPLGQVANLIMGQSPESKFYSDEEIGLPFLQGCAEFGSRFPAHAVYCSQPKKVAPKNSILFSVRAPVGQLNIADRDYIIGRGLAAIIGTRVNQRYLEQFLKFQEANFRSASQGSTFEAINSSELSKWSIESPSGRLEQTKIAEILSTVDQAIDQTEALIAKQQRIKTGLMQDLFTRGIDENGNLRSEETHEFKDSPLGRIPVEWGVKQLSDYYSEAAKNGLYKQKEFYGAGSRMVHMPQMFRGLVVDVASAVRVKIDKNEISRFGLQTHDLLIARRSLVLEGAGRCALVPEITEPTAFESSIIRVRLNQKKLDPTFANYFLNSETGYRMRLPFIRQVAVSGVAGTDVGQFRIPIPDLDEQFRINNFFRQSDAVISELITTASKFKHLKTALMQDLLTGKVSVAPLLTDTEGSV